MAKGPVADTAVKPASRPAAKGARGGPARPRGCGYESRRRRRRCRAKRGGGAARMSDEPGKPARSRPASRPALSPSRAADFKQCPLLYRFRAIDRLPEPPSTAQVRGSVVHAALEQLYGLPAAQRVPETALALIGPAWDQVVAEEPELAGQFEDDQRAELLEQA